MKPILRPLRHALRWFGRRSKWQTFALVGAVAVTVGAGTYYVSQSEAATGWASGACCENVVSGDFGMWRGEPAEIVGCWADIDDSNQRYVWCYDAYKSWTKDVDLAPGMIVKGETMAAAASGAYEARWRQAMAKVRTNWGDKRTVYLRIAHEMNGNWYPWSVTPSNAADFKKAWIRYHAIIQQELVQKGYDAKMTFSVNKDPVNGMDPELYWPGDQYVDVVGVDFYDMYPSYHTQADWDNHYNATKSGAPYGIGAHKAFAERHGKPMAFPEWGANPSSTSDNPFYIEKMHQFMAANAGTGSGQVLYDLYFNTWTQTQIYPTTSIPNAAAKYRSLKWGGIVTGVGGDANSDGRVNALDLSIVITRDGQNYPPADFNADGTIGAADLSVVLSRWTW